MKRPNEPVSLLPTAEPTREDLIFFAGFYEGEGSVQSRKNSCMVSVVQRDPQLLYRARSFWGGSIHIDNRGISSWILSGDRARTFLIAIYPLLSDRRKNQIETAGALTLTGRTILGQSGMTQERAMARAAMTKEQRHLETARRWDERNVEKKKAITRAWQKDNRELLNARQRDRRAAVRMKSCVSRQDISGRSTLPN